MLVPFILTSAQIRLKRVLYIYHFIERKSRCLPRTFPLVTFRLILGSLVLSIDASYSFIFFKLIEFIEIMFSLLLLLLIFDHYLLLQILVERGVGPHFGAFDALIRI